jgi:hypothetical protein
MIKIGRKLFSRRERIEDFRGRERGELERIREDNEE